MRSIPLVARYFLALAWVTVATSAVALPPLGITQLQTERDRDAELAVINGTAYVSGKDGVLPIDASGVGELIVPTSATFGPFVRTKRAVADLNGNVFFGAQFKRGEGLFGKFPGIELYELDNPLVAYDSWITAGLLQGFDSSLNGYTIHAILLPNGTGISPIPFISNEIESFGVDRVAPSGILLGGGAIPNTLGAGPVLRSLGGTAELLAQSGASHSIRDRLDNNGVNIGYKNLLRYGQALPIIIDPAEGHPRSIIVSESDFTVVNRGEDTLEAPENHVFYPGVNPAGDDLSVPLIHLFPELQSLDFDDVSDVTSFGGNIHLLLSGQTGQWLFVAPDPSLIPEPTTASLVMGLFGTLALRRGRRASPEC